MHSEGRTQERLLQRTLSSPQPCEFKEDFFTVLEHMKATRNLTSDSMVIREEVDILRSLRMASTDDATMLWATNVCVRATKDFQWLAQRERTVTSNR